MASKTKDARRITLRDLKCRISEHYYNEADIMSSTYKKKCDEQQKNDIGNVTQIQISIS
jgi:hypothetical protein